MKHCLLYTLCCSYFKGLGKKPLFHLYFTTRAPRTITPRTPVALLRQPTIMHQSEGWNNIYALRAWDVNFQIRQTALLKDVSVWREAFRSWNSQQREARNACLVCSNRIHSQLGNKQELLGNKKILCSSDQTLSQMAASMKVRRMKRAFAIDVHLL